MIAENWEVVNLEDGRCYYWNTETDDVCWTLEEIPTSSVLLPTHTNVNNAEIAEYENEEETIEDVTKDEVRLVDILSPPTIQSPSPNVPPPLSNINQSSMFNATHVVKKPHVRIQLFYRNYSIQPVKLSIFVTSNNKICDHLWNRIQEQLLEHNHLQYNVCQTLMTSFFSRFYVENLMHAFVQWKLFQTCIESDERVSLLLTMLTDQSLDRRIHSLKKCQRSDMWNNLRYALYEWKKVSQDINSSTINGRSSVSSVSSRMHSEEKQNTCMFANIVLRSFMSFVKDETRKRSALHKKSILYQSAYRRLLHQLRSLKHERDDILRWLIEIKTTRAAESFSHMTQHQKVVDL